MDRKLHWEHVYTTKAEGEVSWYQHNPKVSIELVRGFCPTHGRVIDVGGGASRLVDRLLSEGFQRPAVLDVSQTAIERAKLRLKDRAGGVGWIVGDVTEIGELGRFDLWHDRAVFHFLTDLPDRKKYVDLAARTLPPNGHLIIATFALDGPARCSGLDVCRYDARLMSAELGSAFTLVKQLSETHLTPAGKPQQFFWGVFRRN